MEVHNVLGLGFLENTYESSLAHEFALRNIPYVRQATKYILYKGKEIGICRADFLIDSKIIVEIKATSALAPEHHAQVMHYLAAMNLRLALLINFGARSLQFKRFIK